ncbi:MAG: hypothetical protein WAK82_20420, partial [Streptosporangiaceae bacterium]
PGDPDPLHPTAAGELAIALADQQALPKAEGLVPAPSPSPTSSATAGSAGTGSAAAGSAAAGSAGTDNVSATRG